MNKELKINNFDAYQETKMPKGTTVTYELLDIKPDPDNKGMLTGAWKYLRPFDTIEHKDKFYDIGIVLSSSVDGSYTLNQQVSFMPSERFRITLTAGNPVHEEIYKFLEWCNENESNPNRREDVPAVFKKINKVAFAKSAVDAKKALFDAQAIFFAMKEDETRNVANLLGIPSQDDLEVVKSNLLLKIENNADAFLKVAKKAPETLGALVLVKKAIKDGLLKVNKELKTVNFGDDNRVVFEFYSTSVKEAELLADLEKNNPDVLLALRAQLEG